MIFVWFHSLWQMPADIILINCKVSEIKRETNYWWIQLVLCALMLSVASIESIVYSCSWRLQKFNSSAPFSLTCSSPLYFFVFSLSLPFINCCVNVQCISCILSLKCSLCLDDAEYYLFGMSACRIPFFGPFVLSNMTTLPASKSKKRNGTKYLPENTRTHGGKINLMAVICIINTTTEMWMTGGNKKIRLTR